MRNSYRKRGKIAEHRALIDVNRRYFGFDIDERQITHLSCARLKYDLYDFFRGCFWGAFIQEKEQEAGPKHPLKKSYRSYSRWAQIR